jgi:hypothetical protein
MFTFLITDTRRPIQQFFRRNLEKGSHNPLNDPWVELSFTPEDATSILGPATDACVYYNGGKEDESMCLSVSSYLDEVEIYFFTKIFLTDDEVIELEQGRFNRKTAADTLSDDLGGLRSSFPQKLSVVSVIPEDHPVGVNSFYLVNEGISLSLYWADLEHGLMRKLVPENLIDDEYQRILKILVTASESGDEKNALDLLNMLLPEMLDHYKNVGHQLVASARYIGSNENIAYFEIHCCIQNGHEVKRFNVLKEGLPYFQKRFPAIPNVVIEKMAAFIDKQRDAYVQRRWQLANALLANKEATFAGLKDVLDTKKTICGVGSSYLFGVAQWIYARDGFEPAKRLCEFILEYKNSLGDTSNKARKMLVDILMDDRYPAADKVANSNKSCEYLLQIAASTRNQGDINLAINILNAYSGFTMPLGSSVQMPHNFEVPLILHQAEQLLQLNERVKQLESQVVQTPVRFSQSPPPRLPGQLEQEMRWLFDLPDAMGVAEQPTGEKHRSAMTSTK